MNLRTLALACINNSHLAEQDGNSTDMQVGRLSGQREKNKLDKLERIRNATRELFLKKGYDETTTREIALRAGVGNWHRIRLCRGKEGLIVPHRQ